MHDRAHAEIEPADMPRASEPGVTDLLTELARFTAMPDRSKEETLLDAVGTVVRLRALVAERDARIAALEAGLRRTLRALKPFADRVFWDNGDCTVTDTFRCTADDFITAARIYAPSARLLGLSEETR